MRADRLQRLARQYFELAKETSSPFLSASYQHTAEEYPVLAHVNVAPVSVKAQAPWCGCKCRAPLARRFVRP
jgi:hypothetical protein